MDTTRSCGFFLASFLVLVLLRDLTEACKCKPMSLRKACCTHDVVMRVLFTRVEREPNSPYMHLNKFYVELIQIFKGPRVAANVRFFYSPLSESYCGYKHKGPFQEDDYLISGTFYERYLHITKCDFVKPWDKVSARQKMNLEGLAGRDCTTICEKP